MKYTEQKIWITIVYIILLTAVHLSLDSRFAIFTLSIILIIANTINLVIG